MRQIVSVESARRSLPISKTTTKATTTTRSLDGELLWQQEATEFIERFPQRRRPHGTLRQSVSAGALYKNGTAITTINKRASGGELLTTQQRHQRDLFSGDLGIPEVRTHVGSMVHTFETLAMQRKLADKERAKERALALQQQQQWERELLHERNSKYMPALTSATHTTTYTYDTPTHASCPSQHGTSNSKYHKLKRKSHESRQRLIQLSKQQLLAAFGNTIKQSKPANAVAKLESSFSAQTLPGVCGRQALLSDDGFLKRHSTMSLHCAETSEKPNKDDNFVEQYCQLDDDYRKNLFGTISSRMHAPLQQNGTRKGSVVSEQYAYHNAPYNSMHNSLEVEDIIVHNPPNLEHDEAHIVNAAFDEIFASYSGVDDDDEADKSSAAGIFSNATTYSTPGDEQMISLSELDDDVFRSVSTNHINNIGRPGSTPMKLPALGMSAQKKSAPPPPSKKSHLTFKTPAGESEASAPKRKRQIVPLAKQKQRSTTLNNLFDRLKATQTKVKRPFVKIPSDSLLKQDQLNIEQMTRALHKYSPQLDLYREIGEGAAADERIVCKIEAADGDFLRGSTLSQSFVRQLNTRQKKPAPAPPTGCIRSTNISGVNAVNGAPRPLQASQRAKSTNELLLDDLALQSRRYQRAASRKYAAPPTPKKQLQQQTQAMAVLTVLKGDDEATQRCEQNANNSRGHGVGADTTRSTRGLTKNFLRGSAEI
ncbi:unnamed protein product [Ceratitis capitata]|uniref:(Mediterranean fruit fly) hypothetical protein n=1 Tax=Ceratitis capitata TaxID=7213 RepID=A0A811UBI0_CERCA|nr:unnamed protein product [Ceratitis capitata]